MKKIILLTIALLPFSVWASDTIYKHNGERIEGKVIAVTENTITFSYKNESVTYTLGKYAVEKILFESGRTQPITDKVNVKGKEDQDNVVVVDDPLLVVGLLKVDELRAHSDDEWSFNGANKLDKKTTNKLKKYAADRKAFIVLINRDRLNSSFWSKSSTKKGVCYTY